MPRFLRPFRSRITRLLASSLVALSLLLNGLGMAMASTASNSHDCCAGKTGQAMSAHCADPSGKPCPVQSDGCDDQCLMRCQANNSLPSFNLPLPAIALPHPGLPALTATAFVSTDPVPGLRPPISG